MREFGRAVFGSATTSARVALTPWAEIECDWQSAVGFHLEPPALYSINVSIDPMVASNSLTLIYLMKSLQSH